MGIYYRLHIKCNNSQESVFEIGILKYNGSDRQTISIKIYNITLFFLILKSHTDLGFGVYWIGLYIFNLKILNFNF